MSLELKSANLSLANGWHGLVGLLDSAGNSLSRDDWKQCLAEPLSLINDPEKTIKAASNSCVTIKKLAVGNTTITAVVKHHVMDNGFTNFCRGLLPARAIRNFNTACRLNRNNIPVAQPLAALDKKNGAVTKESIFIAEYIPDSSNLHNYFYNNAEQIRQLEPGVRKDMCRQIAGIFASLHKAKLWHRDAKASNFLIRSDADEHKIMLVDMDGIKRYLLRRDKCRWRGPCKLAATLLWCGSISRSDYLRTFNIYCNLSGVDVSMRRRIYRRLARRAVALRLLTLARSAIREKG